MDLCFFQWQCYKIHQPSRSEHEPGSQIPLSTPLTIRLIFFYLVCLINIKTVCVRVVDSLVLKRRLKITLIYLYCKYNSMLPSDVDFNFIFVYVFQRKLRVLTCKALLT